MAREACEKQDILLEHWSIKSCGKLLRDDRGVCQPAESKHVTSEGSAGGRTGAKEHRMGRLARVP